MVKKIIDPWGSELVEDYNKLIKDFGLETFNIKDFPKPNRLMRRGVMFAGRDLKLISKCIKEKKKFYALTGIMPTNDKIHFGNKMVVESLRYFQDYGAITYILVADLESAAARGISLKEAKKRALNFHIPAYLALGLDPKKTVFYFQSENMDVVHLGFEFAQKITLNEFKAIYGSADPGRIMSAVTQVGDILFPQLKETMPGIVPVGIDQDPHMRLTRDVARRMKSKYKFFLPASIYNKYTPALNGDLKMSKSKPESCISLPEDSKVVCKKIMKAKTGGKDTLAEQKKKGGEPEKCIIFELFKQHLIEDDKELNKIYKNCKKGKVMCGEDKKLACDLMTKFMKSFNKKVDKNKKKIKKLKFIKFK
tara:strand:- start:4063 stop:5157 length:1095 start_codon:yes stop_codon:yes gene_type:complete